MDEEIQQPAPEAKISDVEMILIGIFYLALDFIDFIPVAGDITDVIAAPMGFYYWEKKLNGTTFIVSEIIEAIPGAQDIPFVRIISWGITVWMDRSPKLQAALAPAMQVAEVLEGNEEGLENAEHAGSNASPNAKVEGGNATSETGASVEAGESGNSRPSEKSTERGTEIQEEGAEQREIAGKQIGESIPPETEANETSEQRYKREREEDLDRMMESDAEIPAMQRAKEEDFAEVKPVFQNQETEEEPLRQPDTRENQATREASDQFARKQKEPRSVDSLRRPNDQQKAA